MNKWENGVCGGKDIKFAGKVKDILKIFLEIYGYKDFIDNFHKFTA